jgi:rubrerythrin
MVEKYTQGSVQMNTYERLDCGHRVEGTCHPVACPECGGDLQDISVTRG